MSGHTPGPWIVHPTLAQVDAFNPVPAAICKLLWPTEQRSEAETMANAKLIAAAPELLAAAVLVVEVFRDSVWCDGSYSRRTRALDVLQDAVAKANGGAK